MGSKLKGVDAQAVRIPKSDREFLELLHEYIHMQLGICEETSEHSVSATMDINTNDNQDYKIIFTKNIQDILDMLGAKIEVDDESNCLRFTKRYIYGLFLSFSKLKGMKKSIFDDIMSSMGAQSGKWGRLQIWVFGKKED